MNLQKLHFRLYEKGKWYISKHWLQRPKPQPDQFMLPAVVHPTTRLPLRHKVWLLIGVSFGIVYIISAIVSIQIGAQKAMAGQRTSILGTAFSSSTNLSPTPRTTIPKPPPISMGRSPSISPPTVVPTSRPTPVTFIPTPTPCPGGVNCNPWGYNFTPGNLIYNPPVDFCNYFSCVPNFNKPHHPQNGYVVECNDGMYAQFNGEPETCMYHGGVLRPLYAH